jgi:DNA-binding MarR family transcriptional regulator
MATMNDDAPRRLSLLYQLFLANQAARRFMRLSLAETDMTGEEYAVYSYLFANGPRTQTQLARDLGYPVTTLATLLGPMLERHEISRRPHPRDRRARLLQLTDAGRERLDAAIPAFSAAYRSLLTRLGATDADAEALYAALDTLRGAIDRTNDLLESEHE